MAELGKQLKKEDTVLEIPWASSSYHQTYVQHKKLRNWKSVQGRHSWPWESEEDRVKSNYWRDRGTQALTATHVDLFNWDQDSQTHHGDQQLSRVGVRQILHHRR